MHQRANDVVHNPPIVRINDSYARKEDGFPARVARCVSISVAVITLAACRPDHSDQVNAYIDSIPKIAFTEPKAPGAEQNCEPFQPTDNPTLLKQDCVGRGDFVIDKTIPFDPQADALYPGALVQGRSLHDGVLSPLPIEQQPGALTLTGVVFRQDGGKDSISASRPLDRVSLRATTDSVARIIQQRVWGNQPFVAGTVALVRMHSYDQAILQAGLDASWLGGSASSQFRKMESSQDSVYVANYVQQYYTVSYTPPPGNPADFFPRPRSVSDTMRRYAYAKKGQQPDSLAPLDSLVNPPMYVSSITYGRMAVVFIQTHSDSSSITAALQFAFAGQSGHMTAQQSSAIQSSVVTSWVRGGSGKAAAGLLINGIDSLNHFIAHDATWSDSAQAVPISYTLRYLKDRTVAQVALARDWKFPNYATRPTVTGATITFHVGNDGKDHDSGISADVLNGQTTTYFHWAQTYDDKWSEGTEVVKKLDAVTPLPVDAIGGKFLDLHFSPVGNDTFWFSFTLHFDRPDGKSYDFTTQGPVLSQNADGRFRRYVLPPPG